MCDLVNIDIEQLARVLSLTSSEKLDATMKPSIQPFFKFRVTLQRLTKRGQIKIEE